MRDRGTPSFWQLVLYIGLAALFPVLFLIGFLVDSNRNKPSGIDLPRQQVIERLYAASPFPIALTPSPTPAAAAGAQGGGPAQQLKETTTDNKFSDTKLTGKAGAPITMTVTNNGQAIHNWHLLDVKNTDGSDIKTDLLQPGKSGSVTFTITKPGTYNFQCDVHPTEMTGTLTLN